LDQLKYDYKQKNGSQRDAVFQKLLGLGESIFAMTEGVPFYTAQTIIDKVNPQQS
jgi:hypothetical protein